jgi:ketohexokinase
MRAKLVIAWSKLGAYGIEKSVASETGDVFLSLSYTPPVIIDTLAAGDTFNAAVIYSLSQGTSLKDSLSFGHKLAFIKCRQQGLRGIVNKLKF